MRRIVAILRGLFLALAWSLVGIAASLLALEESGVMTELVRQRLASELGPLGDRVAIERVRLLWFEPGLVLEGVTFNGERAATGRWTEGRERLRLSSVHVRLDPKLDPRRPVQRVEIRGGRVILAEPLLDAIQTLLALEQPEEEPTVPRSAPPVDVRGVVVELEMPSGEDLALGSAEFLVRDDAQGRTEVLGRVAPTLAGAALASAEVHLSGHTAPDGGFELVAGSRTLALDSAGMESGSAERLTGLETFRGELALHLEASFQPDLGIEPRANLRLDLARGHLAWPGQVPAEDLDLQVDIRFAPAPGMGLWEPDAWSATAFTRGRWNRSDIEVWAVAGQEAAPDLYLESWMRVRDLTLDEETILAVEPNVGPLGRDTIRRDFAALEPRGRVDAAVSLRFPRRAAGFEGEIASELMVNLDCDGRSEMTFRGWRDPSGARQGCPIPCRDVRGLVLFTRNDALPRHSNLGFVGMSADHGSGRVVAQGMLSTPLEGEAPDVDFLIEVPSLDVDGVLAEGLAGMNSTSWIWEEFQPAGGTLASRWRLRQRQAIGGLSGEAQVEFTDVDLSWREVPVPLNRMGGRLDIRWEDQASVLTDRPQPPDVTHPSVYRPVAVRYELANAAGAGQVVRVRGSARGETLPARTTTERIPGLPTQSLEIEMDDLFLRGRDWETLVARFPELGTQVDELRAQGSIHATFRGRRPAPTAAYRYDVEVRPTRRAEGTGVVLTPRFFGRQTQGLEGRVLLHGIETGVEGESDVSARFTLFGAWGPDVTLASTGAVAAGETALVRVLGAGVDPSNPALKGVLIASLDAEREGGESMDLSSFEVDGRLDFEAAVTLAEVEEEPAEVSYRVFLRDNRLSTEALQLDSLRGVLVQEERILRSPLLRGSLAGTPVELRNVLLLSLEDAATVSGADPLLADPGFGPESGGHALQADWSAAGVVLDREHLGPFVDDETLELMLDVTGLAGRIDVEGARLLVLSDRDGKDKIVFRGDVVPSGVRLKAGLPIEIQSAGIAVERLVLEAGRVRGWWRVDDLDGEVAGRRVQNAGMTMTFVDGRLTIDNLRGRLGGGQVTSLGGLELADRAIAIDLTEPYGYAIAVRLTDVEIEEVLGGLFESTVEDLGELTAWLRLRGRGGDVLALSGGGGISLSEARLWSIPVVRELFRSLGLDGTAIFDQMEMRWDLADGTLRMNDLQVKSPLLQLVGEGTLELTGEVKCDLQVRYSLVDRLGPLNRVVYWLNNSLWQVAIRGDLARPKVLVRNSIAEFLFGFDEDPPRGLPLPGWSPLSSRF